MKVMYMIFLFVLLCAGCNKQIVQDELQLIRDVICEQTEHAK
jgi:hypothetical protein